jgi:class 3 adenylate cyclase
MWRSILAWLTIGSTVTLLLLGLYQTPVAEDFLRRAFLCYQVEPALFADLDLVPVRWLQYGVFTVAAFAVCWVIIDSPHTVDRVFFIVVALAVTLLLSPTLAFHGMLFEPVSGVLAIVFSLSLSLVYANSEWGKRKHGLRRILGGRVSGDTMRRLMTVREALGTGGKQQSAVILTVYFSFEDEAAAEAGVRAELVGVADRLRGRIADFLCARGACMDESSTQCVRVFFGLPLGGRKLAEKACNAALGLRQQMHEIAGEFEGIRSGQIRCGIGLCSDKVVAGMFHKGTRGHYSVIGRGIDRCRQLAIANFTFGSRILVDAPTCEAVGQAWVFRLIDFSSASADQASGEVFELIGRRADCPAIEISATEVFTRGMRLLREGRSGEAVREFQQVRQIAGEDLPDPVLDHFLERAYHCLGPGEHIELHPATPSEDGEVHGICSI